MRVYEFAKEHTLTSKDVLAVLKAGGFEVANHMAVLTPQAQTFLEKKYTQSTAKTTPKTSVAAAKPVHKVPGREELGSLQKTPVKSNSEPHEAAIIKTAKPSPTPIRHNPSVGVLPSDDTIGTIPQRMPSINPTVEYVDTEDQEIQEQARIARLLHSTHLVNMPIAQQQGPRRRRRRKYRPQQVKEVAKAQVSAITVASGALMPLCDVADLFGKQSSELIMTLLRKGQVSNRNNLLPLETIRLLGEAFGITIAIKDTVVAGEQKFVKHVTPGDLRAPVVVVMGHVDHGKTTLLDYIRKMNVAGSEKGGITQHIRAWEVDGKHGRVVFLDTPGHEAFSYMRKQGSKVTDLAVLVVAADDGIMPQTIEAIKHAKDAGVPIIVAINKIDKASSPSAIETIKRQLSQHDLMPEDWGGTTVIAPISAKTGAGIEHLLEMIVLQAQLMDLKAPTDVPAKAFILESHVEKGFGPVATVICREGVIKIGDYFVSGTSTGKIRILVDSHGKRIMQAGPSVPVQVVGFDTTAGLGENLRIVGQQEYGKLRAEKQIEQVSSTPALAPKVSLVAATGNKKSINLILKTDTRGSKEAIMGSIDKLVKANKEIKCPMVIVASGIGDITEGDIELAENTDSIIVGLHVKVERNAQALAKEMDVTVQLHDIIYKMIDELTALLLSKKEIRYVWNKVGEANVLKVFDIKGTGVIAGCYMREGVLSRGNKAECMRSGRKVGEAKVSSLQRDRKSVKEVHAGYECGFTADGFDGWAEGDTVIFYAESKVD